MAILLAIETSTTVCSVALAVDGKVVLAREDQTGASHAAQLGVFVADAVQYARDNRLKINAIAVSSGPGSYTGLRIGMSEAKGLCYGLEIPLIAIPTLKILVNQILPLSSFSFYPIRFEAYLFNAPLTMEMAPLLCPMIDARRMEVYAAIYDENLDEIRPVQADIIDENSYQEYLETNPVIFLGNGSDKCKDILHSPNAIFIPGQYPSATGMISPAEQAFAAKDFVDTAYFEPFYLKEFQATTPKHKFS
ncbi:MAG: tRNA (adenosine(37)-N6)-threonylcarbamoyltransferase complex dimerization subunit type 1 TsaB [Candidatus Symbiothrix sp.]|jgi:tRNA threonylcarbamoyladenosine biosynthesis protein TsaB|nr:tRNA (adenosine(37)-N6)-threonylcarbamoyltransferase complex dimerization subunit type 1 TsaB [Candidatus Symbiothrix sp.]